MLASQIHEQSMWCNKEYKHIIKMKSMFMLQFSNARAQLVYLCANSMINYNRDMWDVNMCWHDPIKKKDSYKSECLLKLKMKFARIGVSWKFIRW